MLKCQVNFKIEETIQPMCTACPSGESTDGFQLIKSRQHSLKFWLVKKHIVNDKEHKILPPHHKMTEIQKWEIFCLIFLEAQVMGQILEKINDNGNKGQQRIKVENCIQWRNIRWEILTCATKTANVYAELRGKEKKEKKSFAVLNQILWSLCNYYVISLLYKYYTCLPRNHHRV